MSPFYEEIYRFVAQIPAGQVVTYGQLAWMAGYPRAARQVGQAMSRCPEGLPWQRVVKSDGSVTGGGHPELRRAMLEAEGIPFLPDGRVELARCQWNGTGGTDHE